MSKKTCMAKRLQTDNKSNVWVEILTLEAKFGSLNLALCTIEKYSKASKHELARERTYGLIEDFKGFPDFKPPDHILEALSEAASGPNYMLNHYTRGYGHPRLVNVLAKMYSRLMSREINPMTDVLVTVGAFEALFCTCQGLIDSGDEVVLLEPYYEPYKEMLRLAEAKQVYVPLKPMGESANDWTFDKQELAAAFTPHTKAIILNNPQNPLGKVYNQEELKFIAELCIKHDVICISDEVYEWLVFDKKKHIRMATLPGMYDRTVTIGSAGKTFSVTGWKVGWVVGPNHLISPMQLFHHHAIRTHCTPTQEAVAVAFEKELERINSPSCYFHSLCSEVERTRNQLCGYLVNAGIRPVIPGGGYFIVADISEIDTGDTMDETNTDEPYDLRFVKWAIQEKKVTMIPMSIFYSPEHRYLGEKYVRICFVKKEETIEKARLTLKKWNQVESFEGQKHHSNAIATEGSCSRDVPNSAPLKETISAVKERVK